MRLLLIATTAFAFVLPITAKTQATARDPRAASLASVTGVRILVAQVSTPLPGGALAYVQRRANANPNNAIVLGPNADPSVLGSAIKVLRHSRATVGDALENDQRIVVVSSTVTGLGPRLKHALEQELRRLRNAPLRELDGVGSVRALERMLPPAKASDRLR